MSVSPLHGKVVWLTGASSGIGEAFAKEAAQAGCRLAISARRTELLEKLAADLKEKTGASVLAAAGDVSTLSGAMEIFRKIRGELGPVDVLVANAGTHTPTNVDAFSTEEYENIMKVNFFGVLHCIEAVLPEMLERRSGHLVGVSSVVAYRALPYAAAYGASKAALSHFLESIRFDLLSKGVDVTLVSPGFVKTPLTDKNDFPMPFIIPAEEAARYMLAGIEKKSLEVHFPKRFSLLLKLLRIIPFPLYHRIIVKSVLRREQER